MTEPSEGAETAEEAIEEAELRALVHSLAGVLTPRAAAGEERGLTIMGAGSDDIEGGRAFLASLAGTGVAVPNWPRGYGGLDATPEQAAIVAAELARFEVPDLYPFMVGIGLVGPTLLTHGTPAQRERWLPAIRDGSEIWCQLFSEPDAGSDLAAMTTRATRVGDTWEVTGSKVWTSRAHYSDWGLLLARTDPSVPKHAGLSAFALDMHAPGVEIRPLRQMNGDTHFSEVFLDQVPVADPDRIDAPGAGWRVAITTLMHERSSIGQGWGNITRTDLIDLARSTGAAADPVRRQALAKLVSALEVNRMTALRARASARASARAGRAPGPEGSGSKIRNSEFLRDLGRFALDVLGPAGVAGDGAATWTTLFLTGPSFSIRGGTDEIQRNILAERVLGLAPEPRVDKDRPFSSNTRP